MAQRISPDVSPLLSRIGQALDHDRPIRVLRGGIVVAGEIPDTRERNDDYETDRTPRSPARPRQGTARRQGPAGRSRPPGSQPRLRFRDLQRAYSAHLSDLRLAYPATRVWPDEKGMWLAIESSVLPGLEFAATFLVGLPFVPGAGPRGWGFWKGRRVTEWIGPRHTNFPDGSICAFGPDEGVWVEGGSLASLVDFYSVWAARHLYLAEFNRWPGRQHAPGPYYRLVEFRTGELCSCGNGQTYFECCRARDLGHDLLTIKREFNAWANGLEMTGRKPPTSILDFVRQTSAAPPSLMAAHPKLRP